MLTWGILDLQDTRNRSEAKREIQNRGKLKPLRMNNNNNNDNNNKILYSLQGKFCVGHFLRSLIVPT
jgi:hypothetical protein